MSVNQSKIEGLIAELCPNGVEFKELREIGDIITGRTPNKSQDNFWGEGIDFITPSDMKSDSKIIKNTERSLFSDKEIEKVFKNNLLPPKSVLVSCIGSDMGKTVMNQNKAISNQQINAIIIRSKDIFSDYIYHYLASQKEYLKTLGRSGGGTMPIINKTNFAKIQIPIPPVGVQEEIVGILDKFTQLEAELEAELEARNKQYEHYRDGLLDFSTDNYPSPKIGKLIKELCPNGMLSFGDKVEWFTLAELTQSTQNIKWKNSDDIYQYIDLSSVDRNLNIITETKEITSENAPSRAQKIVRKNDIIFATTRPTLQRYTIINSNYDGQVASTGYCVLRVKDNVLPKWIYYNIAKTEFNSYVEENQKGASYPAISDTEVKKFKIPLPPIPVQEEIVGILDKFDAITKDISSGLPAEILARKKQYEHYREKLLTFEKLENN